LKIGEFFRNHLQAQHATQALGCTATIASSAKAKLVWDADARIVPAETAWQTIRFDHTPRTNSIPFMALAILRERRELCVFFSTCC
jgi:hypothetical protein